MNAKWNRLQEPQDISEKNENGKVNMKLHEELFDDHKDAIKKIIADHSERAMQAIAVQIGTLQKKSAELDVQEPASMESPANPTGKLPDHVHEPVRFDLREAPAVIDDERSPQPLVVGSVENYPGASDLANRGKSFMTQMQETLSVKSRHTTKRRGKSRKGRSSKGLYEGQIVEEKEFVQKGVFADAEALKQKLRKALAEPTYDVANFYKDTGWCQMLARSPAIENLTLGVIAFNAIWIAVDVDCNDASLVVDADPLFQVIDNFFCFYFVAEIMIRFGAFLNKRNCLKDAWFVFDAFMAISMALETWLLTFIVLVFGVRSGEDTGGDASLLKVFRLFRLVRMARVIRLLSAMPELMVVIKGLAVATRAVSCTVILMLLVIYIFAIFFRQITDGTKLGTQHFKSVPLTMRFLLLHGTMPDVAEVGMTFFDESLLYALLFLFFILMVTITIMNMLVGVLVGVVSTVASVEQEQLVVDFVKKNLMTVLKTVQGSDLDGNGMISREEFEKMLQCPEAINAFNMMGVDVLGLVDLSDFIFNGGKELLFTDFIEMCMQLRGSNQATVKDIVDLRKFMFMELKYLTGMKNLRVDQMEAHCHGMDAAHNLKDRELEPPARMDPAPAPGIASPPSTDKTKPITDATVVVEDSKAAPPIEDFPKLTTDIVEDFQESERVPKVKVAPDQEILPAGYDLNGARVAEDPHTGPSAKNKHRERQGKFKTRTKSTGVENALDGKPGGEHKRGNNTVAQRGHTTDTM